MNEEKKQEKKGLGNVVYIGLLSFFGGISQDIFVPILPIYLTVVLGFDKTFIGVTEGLVTAFASIFKIVSGYLSDKMKSKKSLVFLGYFLSMISRPLLAVFGGGAAILGLRTVDGVGKGLKEAPKDVLIAGSTEATSRGKSFGIARMLDTLGSVVGPLFLFGLLYILQNNPQKYHYILWFTAIPLVITLLILVFKVKEVEIDAKPGDVAMRPKLPAMFYYFLIIVGIFTLGNSSDVFLILRAQNVGVSILALPLVFALFNFIYAAASVPLGSLSDRIGRTKVIGLGWMAYALAYFGFALANQSYQIWLLYAFYGLYYATTQGVTKAFVADMIPKSHRGRAYGILNAMIGVLALPASAAAGYLWDAFSPAAPFYYGAGLSLVAGLLLFVFARVYKDRLIVKES